MTRDDGFTLLEVLVAVLVAGVLFALLGQGMQFGLRTVQVQAAARDREGDIDAVDRTLRRLVQSADPGVYPEPATLHGTAQTVAFTTVLSSRYAGPSQPTDVALSVEGGRLLLRWTPHRHVVPLGPPPPPTTEVLLDGVEGLDLSYWRRDAWVPEWQNQEMLPELVRIRLRFDPHNGRHWPPILVAPLREPVEE